MCKRATKRETSTRQACLQNENKTGIFLLFFYYILRAGRHERSISTHVVYTATTQIDLVRIVTIMILPHFVSNGTILMF